MNEAHWSVSSDRSRGLLRMSISGFFGVDDIASLSRAVGDEIGRMRPFLGGRAHVSICDTSGITIQSREAASAFQYMLSHPAARSRRLAYVVKGSLARMQIHRLTGRDDARFFDSVAAAEAWLFFE